MRHSQPRLGPVPLSKLKNRLFPGGDGVLKMSTETDLRYFHIPISNDVSSARLRLEMGVVINGPDHPISPFGPFLPISFLLRGLGYGGKGEE